MSSQKSISAPQIRTNIPGPISQQWIDRLALRECPAITARRSRRAMSLGTAKDDPIVWKSAQGSTVEDVDGNTYIDLTAGFGVAGVGHRNQNVVNAAHQQLDILIHAMGDAFADPTRIELLDLLQQKTGFERGILGCSGSDAVEAALKTARIATGRNKILSCTRSYHGLAFGSLPITNYKSESFQQPFSSWLGDHVEHIEFGGTLPSDLCDFAGVIVEPIQGRGGIRVAPKFWLRDLIDLAHRDGTMVIFDEIYTGFGRTGHWFAFEHEDLEGRKPDLVCLGKAMGGGFPISVCMGTATAMDSWGASKGEAIHTQTFLGNPLGCAMALACIQELENIIPTVEEKGQWLRHELEKLGYVVQGRGLLLGIQHNNSLALSRYLLHNGFLALPAGIHAEVLAITPPLIITKEELQQFLICLQHFQS